MDIAQYVQQIKTPSLLLRIGVAFAFIYPPLAALSDPYSWIGYFPKFILDNAPNDLLLLHAFGLFEIALAIWILSGKKIFYPSIIAAGMLLGIVVFNWSQMDVLFRDLSLVFMAGALAFLHRPQKN